MFTPTTAYITVMTWLAGLLTLALVPGIYAGLCAPVTATTVTLLLARAFRLDRDQVLRAVALLTVRLLIATVVGTARLALRILTAAETRLAQPTTVQTIYSHAA